MPDAHAGDVAQGVKRPRLQHAGCEAEVAGAGAGVLNCALHADTGTAVECVEVEGPSLTFQGTPWLAFAQIKALMVDSAGNVETLQNKLLCQLSVLTVL